MDSTRVRLGTKEFSLRAIKIEIHDGHIILELKRIQRG